MSQQRPTGADSAETGPITPAGSAEEQPATQGHTDDPQLDRDLRTLVRFIDIYCRERHATATRVSVDVKGFDLTALATDPVLRGHRSYVYSVQFSPSGGLIAQIVAGQVGQARSVAVERVAAVWVRRPGRWSARW